MVTKCKKKELTNCRDTQGTRNDPCPHFTWICLRNYCSETPFWVWGWLETTFLQVPVHYYKTLSSSVKGHRIEDLFQTLMTRSVCSSWLLTLGIKHKRLARLPSNLYTWVSFSSRKTILLTEFLLFIACHCSFLFQGELKMFSIISSCLWNLSSLITLPNYCSCQKRQETVK